MLEGYTYSCSYQRSSDPVTSILSAIGQPIERPSSSGSRALVGIARLLRILRNSKTYDHVETFQDSLNQKEKKDKKPQRRRSGGEGERSSLARRELSAKEIASWKLCGEEKANLTFSTLEVPDGGDITQIVEMGWSTKIR